MVPVRLLMSAISEVSETNTEHFEQCRRAIDSVPFSSLVAGSISRLLRQRTIHPQVDGQSVIMLLSLHAIRNQKMREVVMATTGIDICSPYGMACTECNDLLVAPKWSAYVSKREVCHFWSCENCGHEIEMTVNPRITAASKLSQGVEWSFVG
jgi:transcription elongation factor Elf1